MVKGQTSDDVRNAELLAERARERMAQMKIPQHWLYSRSLDYPTLILAVIGAVLCAAIITAFIYPLGLLSAKYWLGL